MVPKIDKTIVLIIDALRFDFVVPNDDDKFYHNNFPVLYDKFVTEPGNSLLLKFMADPPTTTLQRLKGLTTGSLPTFIDAGSNFNGDEIDEDNWVLQAYLAGKSIAFMGDDTWQALFKKYINPGLNFPYPSLNVWDFHTVDDGVVEHLHPLLEPENQSKWDVLIGHFLGVDHIGHRYGPNHYTMKEKLNQMNREIEHVMLKMDDKTLLLVMGDHGMDPTGNHGGDSKDELESTLFAYTKNKDVKISHKLKEHYDTANGGENYRQVNQIDLVPTISLLMGLPIPHNNLGFPIDEFFSGDSRTMNSASFSTISQINQFRLSSTNDKIRSEELNEQYEFLSTSFAKFKNSRKVSPELIQSYKDYQYQNLATCKQLWAQFDMKFIALGILLLLLSFTFILTYSRSIPSVRILTLSFEFIGSIVAMSLLGIVISLSIYIVLLPHNLTLKNCLMAGVAIGTIIGFWAPIMDRFSVNWLVHQIFDFFIYNFNSWSFLGLIFLVLHCLIFGSNSFVIWEDKMVNFFIATFGICSFLSILTNWKLKKQTKILGLVHSFTFIVVTRLVNMINLCREEQGGYCKPTFDMSWWLVMLLHFMAFLLPLVIKNFYVLSNSYHSAAPLWINTGTKFVLFLNAFYWTFEFLDKNNYVSAYNSYLTETVLKSFKLAIARVVLVVTLVLANYSWSRGPLCVKVDFSKPPPKPKKSSKPQPHHTGTSPSEAEREASETGLALNSPIVESDPELEDEQETKPTATILGYENIYGSSYFLLVLNFSLAIMLTSKPLGALSIGGLLVQILSFLEIIDLLQLRRNLISPILFGLLGYQHFFSTGHQATIPSIQWDVAFLTNESILFPFTHINLVLNNFGSFIIVCLALPLIAIWKIPPTSKPITTLSQIVTIITSLVTYQTLLSLSSFGFTAHFRRHLMVWKIFAPRFMLNGVLLIMVNVLVVVGTLWFGSGKVVMQVNRIFGK